MCGHSWPGKAFYETVKLAPPTGRITIPQGDRWIGDVAREIAQVLNELDAAGDLSIRSLQA